MRIITTRVLLLGFLSWLIPFAASFLFIDRTGQVTVPLPLFKSLMVVIGGGVGTALLAVAFRRITPTLRSGLALGLLWLVLNLGLDLAVLVPMAKMTTAGYLQDIGLRYLLLPIVAAAMGLVADGQRQAQTR